MANRLQQVGASKHASSRSWDKAGYAVLFVLLAITAVQCARLGMAGLLVQTGQFEVERMLAAPKAPAMHQVSSAARFFIKSLEYAPDNPWALEGAGALDLAKMRASRIPRQAHAAARDARARFRLALLQRPTSPMLWANLALAKLHLDEIDGELMTALRHADELGPWEPTVQQTIVFVGLAVWRDLDPATRQVLEGTIRRGAVRNAVKMYEIVNSYARLDLVCAIDKYRIIAGPTCNGASKP
jgi:hypothetical protein